MNFGNIQRAILATGLMAAALTCLIPPFEASYVEDKTHANADIGYYPIWQPPDPIDYCASTFDLILDPRFADFSARESCTAKPKYSYVALTSLAISFTTFALFFLAGFVRRKPR